MTTMQKLVFNVETGEELLIDFTQQELAQQEKDIATWLENVAANDKITLAKASLLLKLGITAEEAKLLLS